MGKESLPARIKVAGLIYAHRKTYKDDFFAVTAMYESSDEKRVILKVNRVASLFLIPMSWVGKLLTAREIACFTKLEGIPGVPRFVERYGSTGLVREFIEGHAMRKGERVPDNFHEKLTGLIDKMHQRDIAYVDLEKCENVLVGDDGEPYLFDFQISWYVPRQWGGDLWPFSAIRRSLQRADRYHLLKLKRRTRPDQMTKEQQDASFAKPWYVRLHNRIVMGPKKLRRWILNRIDPKDGDGERGRVDEEEPMGVN